MNKEYINLCQVFTPEKNIKELLDWCEYKENLYGKKILENSCGDGHILTEVVRRYIEDSIKHKCSIREIRKGLLNDIHGIEFDANQRRKCIKNLEKITEEYNIKDFDWSLSIKRKDTLRSIEEEKFDFVVGNPPYIKYRSLVEEDRNYVRERFETCKNGKFDYCYAFIEASLISLKENGVMAYLIPSSIFKNVFANDLREYIKPHLLKIYDYTTTKLFDENSNAEARERMTSSAIMVLKKNSNKKYIEYIDVTNDKRIKIKKTELQHKWIFKNGSIIAGKKKRFGDYFNAANTIATLYNKAYVIDKYKEYKNFVVTADGYHIEKDIIKDTVSPKTFNRVLKEKIIFPYTYNENNELIRFEEGIFEEKYKGACEYLKKNIEALDKRCSDKNAKWFEYGRSQALKNSNQEKILLSTVITNEVKTRILKADNIPYSGIYITQLGNKSLEDAEKILHSRDFFEYIKEKGINASGKSLRITAKDINEYIF